MTVSNIGYRNNAIPNNNAKNMAAKEAPIQSEKGNIAVGTIDKPTGLSTIKMVNQAAQNQKPNTTKNVLNKEYQCKTCAKRSYQDQSSDPGVSMKTPTKLTPEQAATAVSAHEGEHVAREKFNAEQQGGEVVSQTVTLHMSICPECGKAYVSGGTTRTTTKTEAQSDLDEQQNNFINLDTKA